MYKVNFIAESFENLIFQYSGLRGNSYLILNNQLLYTIARSKLQNTTRGFTRKGAEFFTSMASLQVPNLLRIVIHK